MNNSPETNSKNPSDTKSMGGVERYFFRASTEDFKKIPGGPIVYWASNHVYNLFSKSISLSESIETREGLTTGSNDIFLRFWHEVSIHSIDFKIFNTENSDKKWFKYIKGGEFRRWSGNYNYIVNWQNDGEDLRKFVDSSTGRVRSHNYNGDYAFRTGFTWSGISSGSFAVRHVEAGFMFDAKGPMGFSKDSDDQLIHEGFLNSSVTSHLIRMLAPTLDFKLGHILNLPFRMVSYKSILKEKINKIIALSFNDWNNFETSWDFTTLPLLHPDHHHPTLAQTYANLRTQWQDTTLEMQRLEEENNRIFIEAYGLQEELTPDVPLEEITLTCNPRYRYGKGKNDDDYETLLRCDTVKELISYAIGCMMGRYSLDEPGLVYAHSGNQGFDPDRYRTFPADEDGILPVMDMDWFDDDATRRLSAFIQCVWPEQHLDDNLSFMAECLTPRAAESSLDTIRRYLSTTFFKDHMRTYKKRPIYWLFSSGRQKAFTCLVYLHRYHPATLSRMRSHYVTPLQGKLAAHMEFLDHERKAAATPSAQKKIQTQMDLLKKKQAELNAFDDELRHYADMKIDLDLDDGVKVNYARFGNLLAERKAITGK